MPTPNFKSDVTAVGTITFPEFSAVRVMMLPFRLEDVGATLPDELSHWRACVAQLCGMADAAAGVGYLTIDEAIVKQGETHRRPGLHVDGIGPDGRAGGWGGGGGGWGSKGMLTTSSHVGCAAWDQDFAGWPQPDGDCHHLRAALDPACEIIMQPGVVYHCGALAVHESLPMSIDTRRQFVRVSMPSAAPWYEGYTRNPCGVVPDGPIHPPRAAQMGYRV